MKILINSSHLRHLGGVSNHYLGLKEYWSFQIIYNSIGTRFGIPGIILFPFDILKFILLCIWNRPDAILLNPSLGKKAIKRDALYLTMARKLNIKTIVFIHGWNQSMEQFFDEHPNRFFGMYKEASGFIVLADEFRIKLKSWGIKVPIFLTTTKVNDQLLSNFSIALKPKKITLLFLARIEKEKGVFIVIDTFIELKKTNPNLKLIIAGNGSAYAEAHDYVQKSGIHDIEFTGRISGEALKSTFMNTNIYVLPTSHGEGMPTSILEAMAFGHAIITTPIGGVKDFFEEGKMGYLIQSYEVKDYANKISYLIENIGVLKSIGNYNFKYAKDNFMASKVAQQLESVITKIIE